MWSAFVFSPSSSLEYGSIPGGPSVFHAGTVDDDKYEKLLDNLNGALAKAAQRFGDKRTAAGGKQGARSRNVSLNQPIAFDSATLLESCA